MRDLTKILAALVLLLSASQKCIAQSKTQIILDATSQAALWADMTTTEHNLKITRVAHGITYHPFGEGDPLAKPFVTLPKPAYFTLGTAMGASLAFLSNKMKKSPHRWEHKIWWIPQVVQISVNSLCAVHNIRLSSQ